MKYLALFLGLMMSAAFAQQTTNGTQIRNGGLVSVTATGSSIASSLADRFSDTLNVKRDCGAIGNGLADDTAAIQTCLTRSNPTNNTGFFASKPVYIPAGTYLVAGLVRPSGTELYGAGPNQTVLKLKNGANTWVLADWSYANDIASPDRGGIVRDLQIDGNLQNNTTGTGYFSRSFANHVSRVRIRNNAEYGIVQSALTQNGTTLANNNFADCRYVDIQVDSNGLGGFWARDSASGRIADGVIYGGSVFGNGVRFGFNIKIDRAPGWRLSNIAVYGNAYDSISLSLVAGTELIGMNIDNNGYLAQVGDDPAAIRITSFSSSTPPETAGGVSIIGNYIKNDSPDSTVTQTLLNLPGTFTQSIAVVGNTFVGNGISPTEAYRFGSGSTVATAYKNATFYPNSYNDLVTGINATGLYTGKNSTAPNSTTATIFAACNGPEANISCAIVPKGTGAITAAIPDNTTVGGSLRGNNAVDLQTVRTNSNQVAGSTNSGILSGTNNRAAALNSVVAGGGSNLVDGLYSYIAGGFRSITNARSSSYAFGIEGSTVQGSRQSSGQNTTADILNNTSAKILTANNAASATATNTFALQNNSSATAECAVNARDTVSGDVKAWKVLATVKRGAAAANTALVGTPTITVTGADTATNNWVITGVADTTNGSFEIQATIAATGGGALTNTVKVFARCEFAEVTN